MRKLSGMTREIAVALMEEVPFRSSSINELTAAARLMHDGYAIVRRGWPDLIAIRQEDIRFIEVKGPQGRMKLPQIAVAAALQIGTGITTEIWPGGEPDKSRQWWDDWKTYMSDRM